MMKTRTTVRGLLIVVGLICVILGAFRFHFSLGCFVSGVIAMATVRTSEKLGQLRSIGSPIRDRDRFGIFGTSLVPASCLLATSLVPTLCVFAEFGPSNTRFYRCRRPPSEHVSLIMMSAILGYPIAVLMRRLIW